MNKNIIITIQFVAIIVIGFLYFRCHCYKKPCCNGEVVKPVITDNSGTGGKFISTTDTAKFLKFFADYYNIDNDSTDPIYIHRGTFFSYDAIDLLRKYNPKTNGFVCYPILTDTISNASTIIVSTNSGTNDSVLVPPKLPNYTVVLGQKYCPPVCGNKQ